jgi:hypothetical protein
MDKTGRQELSNRTQDTPEKALALRRQGKAAAAMSMDNPTNFG